MASLTLKNIPDGLLQRLRAAAARDRRSMMQEALVLIEGGLAALESAEERTERQLAAWRSLAGSWRSDESFEDEVAAIYEARTSGRDVDL
jgi:plasmid stability protein